MVEYSLIFDFCLVVWGLVVRVGAPSLSGFEVAGKEGQFHPARAIIVNNQQVQVKSDRVAQPVNVRYLWVNSADINFFNKEGFPALPFRTDTYPLETEGVSVNPVLQAGRSSL